MPIIGIMQYSEERMSPVSTFVAGIQRRDKFEKVTFYHEDYSSALARICGPWKQYYEEAALTEEGTTLARPDGRLILSGKEKFLLFSIPGGLYSKIFDHGKDSKPIAKRMEFFEIMTLAGREGYLRTVNEIPVDVSPHMKGIIKTQKDNKNF